jgi:non-ribosomal peptide synthetase component F
LERASPTTLLHQLFERSVKHFLDHPCLEMSASLDGQRPQEMFTYIQVEAMANELAMQLRSPLIDAFRTDRNPTIPIFMARNDPMLYVSQLAFMKAGGAYTIIQPTFPEDRVSSILEDTEPRVVLTNTIGESTVRANPYRR